MILPGAYTNRSWPPRPAREERQGHLGGNCDRRLADHVSTERLSHGGEGGSRGA